MKVLGIIPARYASSRFPGKPLVQIKGKSMLQRVYENAVSAGCLSYVTVATDDQRIMEHCHSLNIPCIMTSESHPSGTDRCMEAFEKSGMQADYVLNIQGDEPLLHPLQIKSIVDACSGAEEILTQFKRCENEDEIFSTGEVKIVMNENREALYFSRSPIPYLHKIPREEWPNQKKHFRHVGMYAYRTDILKWISSLKPSALEMAEGLEQLRWLENGFKIKCVPTEFDSHCVDTPEDLMKILEMIKD
jgi:3-deoxy-manno-octulosonate cytidylyltransferase (CMP-KDO synthetase)